MTWSLDFSAWVAKNLTSMVKSDLETRGKKKKKVKRKKTDRQSQGDGEEHKEKEGLKSWNWKDVGLGIWGKVVLRFLIKYIFFTKIFFASLKDLGWAGHLCVSTFEM